MDILDIVHRETDPEPWSEGDNIPWNEPGFSARMLKEHLSQEHDAASRRSEIIEKHVSFIHARLLQGQPARILDLGCGPGLYANRLAKLGHTVTGIDFSPASIRYARQQAEVDRLDCTFIEADIRQADYGNDEVTEQPYRLALRRPRRGVGTPDEVKGCYDLTMLIFGEFNVFRPADAGLILAKACLALKPGGILLLEPHTYAAVRKMGDSPAAWYSTESGLFSSQPHLCLKECRWDESCQAATWRYFIIDAHTNAVTRYASSLQAYTDEAYRQVIANQGFDNIAFYPSLGGDAIPGQEAFFAITARKPLQV